MQKYKCIWLQCLTTAIILTGCYQQKAKTIKAQGIDTSYNVGRLSSADTIKHTFYIKSTGDGDLKIDSVVAACDCVTLKWQKGPISPGKTGFISVAVKPNDKLKDKGLIKRYIMARTNAANNLTVFQVLYSW